MLCMTMKLGQGSRVSVCGFVVQACDCHVTLYSLGNEAPSRKMLGIELSFFKALTAKKDPKMGQLWSLVSILKRHGERTEKVRFDTG